MGLFGISGWINLESESYPLAQDLFFLPFFAFLFPCARLCLDRYVFEGLARRLIFGKGHSQLNFRSHENRKKVKKFKESAWKCVYFLSAELLALCVNYDEPWFSDTKYFWKGPGDHIWPEQKIKSKLKGLYLYAGGFYIYSSFALVFWETRRSDFYVSMSHHIATVILILLSYIFRFARVDSVIIALHEGSDVILELAKMSKYCGCEGIAGFFFVVFALSWTVLRLFYFPFWILWSTTYEVVLVLDKEKQMLRCSIYYYLLNTLLFSLLVCHVYWWILMLRMVISQIKARGQISDDIQRVKNMKIDRKRWTKTIRLESM